MFGRKKKKREKLTFELASDVVDMVTSILSATDQFGHIKLEQVRCMRSRGSQARAYARTWGLSRIFQEAVGYKPVYVIEIISKYFDKLSKDQQIRVILHELMHIPKTFSGALLPHSGKHHRIDNHTVERIFKKLQWG